MMLRKTSTATLNNQSRDQPMPESRNPSLFSVTGLLVGFAKGVVAEPDSARSPTSPLDYMVFSGFGSHLLPSPRSQGAVGAPRKSWDCDRVGLGLVDSLTDGGESCCRFLLGSPENRSILLGWQACINIPSPKIHLDRLLAEGSTVSPKSLPKDYMTNAQTRVKSPCFNLGSSKMRREHSIARLELGELEKIQSCCCPHAGSLPDACDFMASLSAKNIEQSEDYTCIISHGPNPRTTRIFGDCILGSCSGDVSGFSGDHHGEEGRGCSWMVKCSEDPMSFPAEDFLRVCFSCKKKLEGKDIYMYRGEKAFCSCSCRSQEILVEEEMEEPPIDSSGPTRICCYEEVFLPGVAVAT